MSRTVSSVERQAELNTCQNALKAPLMRVKVGKRSEGEKKSPCHWVAGASLELLCASFSLLTASLGLDKISPLGGLQTQHIKQQISKRQILPPYPVKTPNGVLLIGRVLGAVDWSLGEARCVWGGFGALPVLQPGSERDVWVRGRQCLFCGHSGGCSFRALQVQPVIHWPDKPVAHPTCIKQAIELYAGPLYWAELQEQWHMLGIEDCSLCSFLPSSVPHCQLGGFVSPEEMFLAFDSWLPHLCSDRLRVSHLPFPWAPFPQDLFSMGSAWVVTLRPSISPAVKDSGVLEFWTQEGDGKLFTFPPSYLSSVKRSFMQGKG